MFFFLEQELAQVSCTLPSALVSVYYCDSVGCKIPPGLVTSDRCTNCHSHWARLATGMFTQGFVLLSITYRFRLCIQKCIFIYFSVACQSRKDNIFGGSSVDCSENMFTFGSSFHILKRISTKVGS